MLQGKKKHVIQDNLDIIRLIGIDNKDPKMEFYFSKEDEKKAKEKLTKLKVKSHIIVHPGSGSLDKTKFPAKLWPLERYSEIVDYLQENYKTKILMTGSENERKLNNKIIGLTKGKDVLNFAGLFNLGELAYIISESKLIICPNTSIVHFASIYNTPLVELEGFGRMYQWSPWRKDKNYVVLHHNEKCTGCNAIECRKKDNECMKAISVEEVKDAVRKLLN
jgi:heptosyltransferase-3